MSPNPVNPPDGDPSEIPEEPYDASEFLLDIGTTLSKVTGLVIELTKH